jgi:hypothetical protein
MTETLTHPCNDRFSSMQPIVRFIILGICLVGFSGALHAADLKLEAKLVWGTNDDKDHAKCKPVSPELAEKLNGMFKWKRYFEITNETAMVPVNQTRSLKMSEHCTLELKNVGGSRVEVHYVGDGKQVHQGAYTVVPPQWLVFGGNDKDNTAWFIGLRAVDDSKKAVSRN